MPKPDGSLYWYEKERLEGKPEPKKAKRHTASRSGKRALPPTDSRAVGEPVGVTKAQQLVKDADVPSIPDVVSIETGQPVKKKSGPKPGHSNHPLQPSKGGRPTVRVKATPEMVTAICADVRKGLSIESACILQGIARSGVDRWRKLNPSVNAQFEKAESEFESDILGFIRIKAPDDVKAATWLLERGRPQRWAQVSKSELSGKNGKDLPALTVHKTLLGSMSTVDAAPKKLERSA
jgi:hypothetical protein